jgi:hypothetical protein
MEDLRALRREALRMKMISEGASKETIKLALWIFDHEGGYAAEQWYRMTWQEA